ncbi:hypothetical protein JCM10213v2_006001 [Rhodosporidiobolus nylandii]
MATSATRKSKATTKEKGRPRKPATLEGLPAEILSDVFRIVDLLHPAASPAWCLVNKRIYALVQAVRSQVSLPPLWGHDRLSRLLQHSDFYSSSFTSPTSTFRYHLSTCTLATLPTAPLALLRALSSLPNLRHLSIAATSVFDTEDSDFDFRNAFPALDHLEYRAAPMSSVLTTGLPTVRRLSITAMPANASALYPAIPWDTVQDLRIMTNRLCPFQHLASFFLRCPVLSASCSLSATCP